ncbi:MAG: hypothetical protein H6983_06975 [Ectothiorhodospiraceae bacterium]|nr:hypothetical protein [Ectothiorhodospiraceae bacterium]
MSQSHDEGARLQRQAWETPQLTVHGTVEALTLQKNKTFGAGDDVLFEGNDILAPFS